MNDILERYYQLLLKDKKYLEEYILNETTEDKMLDFMKRQIEECFIWRKANSYEELEDIAHSKKAMELLRISDYYSDEMCELLEKHLGIDLKNLTDEESEHILSNDNLQRILENEDTPKQLKDCIEIEGESQIICKEMYEYMMKNQESAKEQIKVDFGNVKKCAIFVHYSINDTKRIEEKKNRLITFCKDILETNNYEVFVEVGSFLGDRKIFNNMLKKFESGEFSHIVVTDVGQIYKLSYDMQKAQELTDKIQNLNVSIICVDEEKVIEGRENNLSQNLEDLEEVNMGG